MGAIVSFLGGAAFRLIWGSVTDFFNKRQQHAQELDTIRLQGTIAAEEHVRSVEKLRIASELGIKEIQVKHEAAIDEIDAKAFSDAASVAVKPIGIRIIDAWNGSIRPAAASISLFLWTNALFTQNFRMTEWDMELVGVILGFYFAARTISQGK